MTVPVPVRAGDRLNAVVEVLGEPARRWLAGLPVHLAETAAAWDLQLDDQLDHIGFCSVIYPATTRDGRSVVLKATIPQDESAGEAAALRRWDGDGAVEVLRSSDDGFTLLLERCVPGHDLWTLPIDDQIDVMAGLLPRLWVPPSPDIAATELSAFLERCLRRMRAEPGSYDYPREVVRRAADWAEQLAAEPSGARVLLHGDINPGNVLAASREPWLAIDPKPFVGEPTFELAQVLLNWAWGKGDRRADQAERIVQWTTQLAELLGLDRDRTLRWGLVKAVGWEGARDDVLLLHAAATSVLPDR